MEISLFDKIAEDTYAAAQMEENKTWDTTLVFTNGLCLKVRYPQELLRYDDSDEMMIAVESATIGGVEIKDIATATFSINDVICILS